MYTFSPRTKIESAKVNANFTALSDGSADTTTNSLSTFRDEVFYDFVISGCLWSGDAYATNRLASMSSGVVVIGGVRIAVSGVTSRTFTASKDTYVYVDNAGTISYSEVSNNAASPSQPANSLLLGIVITGATTIAAATSINQGNLEATTPTVSSQILKGSDTNGVPIYNTNPVELCFRRIGTASPAPTVEADVSGATMTFTLAKPAKVYIDLYAHFQINTGADRNCSWVLNIDGTNMTQLYGRDNAGATETHFDGQQPYDATLAAGAHTIKIRSSASTAGTVAMNGGIRVRIRG